jgi:hypothetical protein
MVGGQKDGHAACLLQLVERSPQIAPNLGVQTCGRLIQKDEGRPIDEDPGHIYLSRLPGKELAVEPNNGLRYTSGLGCLLHPWPGVRAFKP